MSLPPQNLIAFLIRQNLRELDTYTSVFEQRIARAFDGLDDEARRVQEDAYASVDATGPDDDPSSALEWAYHKGVDFYLATDAVRQGIFNLTVAGLFHLFEQQMSTLLSREFPKPAKPPKTNNTLQQYEEILNQVGVDITTFKSHQTLDELRLVANAVKHGDGKSAAELRGRNPTLFESTGTTHDLPLRPLIGQGLCLSEDNFTQYSNNLHLFWTELLASL